MTFFDPIFPHSLKTYVEFNLYVTSNMTFLIKLHMIIKSIVSTTFTGWKLFPFPRSHLKLVIRCRRWGNACHVRWVRSLWEQTYSQQSERRNGSACPIPILLTILTHQVFFFYKFRIYLYIWLECIVFVRQWSTPAFYDGFS